LKTPGVFVETRCHLAAFLFRFFAACFSGPPATRLSFSSSYLVPYSFSGFIWTFQGGARHSASLLYENHPQPSSLCFGACFLHLLMPRRRCPTRRSSKLSAIFHSGGSPLWSHVTPFRIRGTKHVFCLPPFWWGGVPDSPHPPSFSFAA